MESNTTLYKLTTLMRRSTPAIEGAVAVLGREHRVSRDLATFLTEIQSLHETTRRELLDCQHFHQVPPSQSQPAAPHQEELPSVVFPSERGRPSSKMLRFSRKEMDFVRNMKGTKATISEISHSLTLHFPKWLEVEHDRLLAKIRRVRKRTSEEEGGGGLHEEFTDDDDEDTLGAAAALVGEKRPRVVLEDGVYNVTMS